MKMEIELTEAQAEKVQILKENGIEIGEAIEMSFEMKDAVSKTSSEILDLRIERAKKEKAALQELIAEIDEDLAFYEQVKDTSLDPRQKQVMVEKEYDLTHKTYDESLQDTKHKMKWSNFFKF